MTIYVYIPGLATSEGRVPLHGFDPHSPSNWPHLAYHQLPQAFPNDLYMGPAVRALRDQGAHALLCTKELEWDHYEPDDGTYSDPHLEPLHVVPRAPDYGAYTGHTRYVRPPAITLGGTHLAACDAEQRLSVRPTWESEESDVGALSHLRRGDVLYLVGHANTSGSSLAYKRDAGLGHHCNAIEHSSRWHIRPDGLARLLRAEGLDPDVRLTIYVFACFSGGIEADQLQNVEPLAERLHSALGALGYGKVTCRGATSLTTGQRGQLEVSLANPHDPLDIPIPPSWVPADEASRSYGPSRRRWRRR